MTRLPTLFGISSFVLLLTISAIVRAVPVAAQAPTPTVTPSGVVDLAVTLIASPDPIVSGNPLTYAITVRNLGPATAPRTTVVASIPTGTTFSSGGPCTLDGTNVRCPVAPLGPDQQARFTYTVQVTLPVGSLFNNAVVDLETAIPDPDRANNGSSVITTVLVASPTPTVTTTGTPGPSPTPSITPTLTPTLTPTPGFRGGPELGVRATATPAYVEPTAVTLSPTPVPADPAPSLEVPPETPPVALPPVPPVVEILAATSVYSDEQEVLWTAQPGEGFEYVRDEPGWVLVVALDDPANPAVWLQLDEAVQVRPGP